MAHHTLVYFIIACFTITFFLAIFAFLDSLIDERQILATPTISKKRAIHTALATTRINASAQDVFQVLVDFQGWARWNTHIPGIIWESTLADGIPLVGTKGKVRLNSVLYIFGSSFRISGKAAVILTVFDRERTTIASKLTSVPGLFLRAERVYEVIPVRKDLCEFRTWETFGGFMGFVIKYLTYPSVEESGNRCAANLRDHVEKLKGTAQPVQAPVSLLYH